MLMLVQVTFPHEPFNTSVRKGTAGKTIERILDDIKPNAVYFTECSGRRSATIIVDVDGPSDVPRLAEPWFLLFNADVEFHICMSPQDLDKADLETLGRKWA